jgi:hypothetical protein
MRDRDAADTIGYRKEPRPQQIRRQWKPDRG